MQDLADLAFMPLVTSYWYKGAGSVYLFTIRPILQMPKLF